MRVEALEKKLEGILEAVLFTMGDAVSVSRLAEAFEYSEDEIKNAIGRLMERYDRENRGIKIIELEDSYQMCTNPQYYEELIKVAKTPKRYTLTDTQIETLSIIAYKQPVTKVEIENIRGVSSDHVVNRLVEFGLVCEVGRLNAPGKPMLFGTTEEFLRSFGVQSLEDLPHVSAERMEEFKEQAEAEVLSSTTMADIEV